MGCTGLVPRDKMEGTVPNDPRAQEGGNSLSWSDLPSRTRGTVQDVGRGGSPRQGRPWPRQLERPAAPFLKPFPYARRPIRERPADQGLLMRCVLFTFPLLIVLMGAGGPVWAQQVPATVEEDGQVAQDGNPTPPAEPVTLDPESLPVNVDRIQRRLSRPPAIRPETSRHVFRVTVFGRSPTIDEILGPNWRRGPVPAGAMTHQEFLNMVTPRDVQGFAAFDNRQGLMVAATSFALQWALRQAVQKLDDARTERQKEAAQREVDEALAALRKARRDAGLPER